MFTCKHMLVFSIMQQPFRPWPCRILLIVNFNRGTWSPVPFLVFLGHFSWIKVSLFLEVHLFIPGSSFVNICIFPWWCNSCVVPNLVTTTLTRLNQLLKINKSTIEFIPPRSTPSATSTYTSVAVLCVIFAFVSWYNHHLTLVFFFFNSSFVFHT